MFNELENSTEALQETKEVVLVEDPESAILEGNEEIDELTDEVIDDLEDLKDSLQDLLDAYAVEDQEALAELEIKAASTETVESSTEAALTIENGSSCGYGHGCSGSTWCVGCGEAR